MKKCSDREKWLLKPITEYQRLDIKQTFSNKAAGQTFLRVPIFEILQIFTRPANEELLLNLVFQLQWLHYVDFTYLRILMHKQQGLDNNKRLLFQPWVTCRKTQN